jgi:hypothetical protein
MCYTRAYQWEIKIIASRVWNFLKRILVFENYSDEQGIL